MKVYVHMFVTKHTAGIIMHQHSTLANTKLTHNLLESTLCKSASKLGTQSYMHTNVSYI